MKITGILMAEDLRKLSMDIRHRHHEGDEPPIELPILPEPMAEEDRRWIADRLTRPMGKTRGLLEPEFTIEEQLEICHEVWRMMTGGAPDTEGEVSADLFLDYTVMALQLRHSARFAQRAWRMGGPCPDTDLPDDAERATAAEIPF